MAKIKLTKRKYLGFGYVHRFKNDTDGTTVFIPCSQEEYDSLALPNAPQPTLAGHTWLDSAGGTIKVDTPTTLLGDNEYCIDGEDAHVVLSSQNETERYVKMKKSDINVNDEVDELVIGEAKKNR